MDDSGEGGSWRLMESSAIPYRRLAALRLAANPLESPGEVVRRLGAVQSQDYAPAKWSVAQRTGGPGDAAVEHAFAHGAILRTHILRPTWHFVSPEDIRWMLELTAPRVRAVTSHYHRRQGLDAALLSRCHALLASALQGGHHHTRKEIAALLADAGIAVDGLRLGFILMDAELSGLICSGAPQGKQQTYALLDERAPQAKRLNRDEALAELTIRYFTSHGPATMKDFQWWSSLTMTDIKRGLQLAASQLASETIDGLTYWLDRRAIEPNISSPDVHLLQGYDEYIVGYSQSKHLIDRSGAARSAPRPRGIYTHAVVLDGQIAGHWKPTPQKERLLVEVSLFSRFNRAQTEALEAAVKRYGLFLGISVTLEIVGESGPAR